MKNADGKFTNLINPLEEIQALIIRIRHLKRTYGITNSDIYDIEYWLDWNEREFMQNKPLMNDEIKKYPIFIINKLGGLIRVHNIQSTDDYDHHRYNLHHFIKMQDYYRNQAWYEEQGIKQKLILMRIPLHEQLHYQAVKNLSDSEFIRRYKTTREKLYYNKRKGD